MRNVTVAAVQMKCSKSVEKNIAHAEELVRQAAAKGAEIVLLPELFERPYFCQERRYEYYEYAQTAEENPAVRHFSRVAAELGIVIPVSFYEKEVNNTYNSVAVLDADGKNLGIYRKTHIPDDHYYQEKFYFTPGDTGFKVLIPDLEPLELESAGISGSRKRQDVWHCREQSFSFIPLPSEVNPSWNATAWNTGEDVCRDTLPPT